MKRTRIPVFVAAAIATGSILLAATYRDNARATRFGAALDALAESGPEIRAPGTSDPQTIQGNIGALEELYRRHNQAWCNGDGGAYAATFTDDAGFIAFDGTFTTGRPEIAASHQQLFDTFLRGTCLVGQIQRIKFLHGDIAILYVISGTTFDGEKVRRPSIQTYVAVRVDGSWRFASFHNGRIDPIEERNILRQLWLGFKTVLLRR